jgi:hypothetical protein
MVEKKVEKKIGRLSKSDKDKLFDKIVSLSE